MARRAPSPAAIRSSRNAREVVLVIGGHRRNAAASGTPASVSPPAVKPFPRPGVCYRWSDRPLLFHSSCAGPSTTREMQMTFRYAVLAGALALSMLPIAADAQPPAGIRRIGILSPAPPAATARSPYRDLREALRELGYVE